MSPRSLSAAMVIALAVATTATAQTPAAGGVMPSTPAPIVAEKIPPQVDTTFAMWDLDHNGALSLQEFRNGWLMLRRLSAIELRLQRQFQIVDRNHDGAIDADEYTQLALVKAAGKTAPSLSTFDGNHDQRLNFAEYTDLVRRLAPKQPHPPVAPTPGRPR